MISECTVIQEESMFGFVAALRERLLLRSSGTRLLFPPALGVECLMPLRSKSRAPKSAQATQSRFANVNGVRLHYLIAGKGDPVMLLHLRFRQSAKIPIALQLPKRSQDGSRNTNQIDERGLIN